MKVRDKIGNEIYISVYGKYDDDIQIDDAYYLDIEDDVSDETIEYIMDRYAQEIYEEWYENKSSDAEDYYEGDR